MLYFLQGSEPKTFLPAFVSYFLNQFLQLIYKKMNKVSTFSFI